MTRLPMNILLGLMLCFGVAACGGDDEDLSVADQPLQGLAFGQEWQVEGASTNAFLSDDDEFWVDAYIGAPSCGGFAGDSDRPKLIISVPRTVGTHKLSLNLNMTFAFMNDNLVATDGVIIVEEVTETSVTASLRASFDGDNNIEGRFTAEICPDPSL